MATLKSHEITIELEQESEYIPAQYQNQEIKDAARAFSGKTPVQSMSEAFRQGYRRAGYWGGDGKR